MKQVPPSLIVVVVCVLAVLSMMVPIIMGWSEKQVWCDDNGGVLTRDGTCIKKESVITK